MTEQAKCKHPFDGLRWGANSKSMYATCGKCGVKSVVLYHKAKDQDMPEDPEEPDPVNKVHMVNEVHVVKVGAGMVMADTGCRKAVGGTAWHHELQDEMDKLEKTIQVF